MLKVIRRAGALAAAAGLLAAAPAAAESVLGIPCGPEANGVRACIGDGAGERVRTWDGVPLDVDVFLPSPSRPRPYPTVVTLHGFGEAKGGADLNLVRDGYAVVQYSARGFGNSCGLVISRGDSACARGWSHLADVRYEPRDTQYLLGLLVDAGVTDPKAIGVTGTSYGAGQSLMLATLRDRVAMPDGKLVPWRSPAGTPLHIAAAAPNWPWSDLASMLIPEGSTLDYKISNPYGPRIGVPKLSYVVLLAAAGGALNYFAPPGADFGSDAYGWIAAFAVGEPYGDLQRRVVDEIRRWHSALGIEDGLPDSERHEPAPVFVNASWPDDLTTPTETLRWRNAVLARWPRAEVDVLFSDGAGHPRAHIAGTTPGLEQLQHDFFDRHLRGAKRPRVGVRTSTQTCDGKAQGPFVTRTWAQQHPGEVRFSGAAPQQVISLGDPVGSIVTDPVVNIANSGCVTTQDGSTLPGAASYRLPPAPAGGWTVMGSPTVVARMTATTESAQLAARLWDVAPGGRRTLMARVAYRPTLGHDRLQVFQLHPTGWSVAQGHVVQLELLGSDQPYVRASNLPFTVTVRDLQLRLPVRERPGSRTGVDAPAQLLDRDGSPLPKRLQAIEAAPEKCTSSSRATISVKGLRHVRATLRGRRLAVRRGRVVVDLRKRPAGRYVVTIRGTTRAGRRTVRHATLRVCGR